MKSVVIIVSLLCVGAFCWTFFLADKVFAEPGRPIAIAFGTPTDKTMELHIGVPPKLFTNDGPENEEGKRQSISEWIAEHFQLRHESGENVPLQRMGTSGLMLGKLAAGVPEFVVWAELPKGESYTCDLIPVVASEKRYRFAFTVPHEPEKVRRGSFEYVLD